MTVHLVHADQEGKLAVVVRELGKDLPKDRGRKEALDLDKVQIDVSRILPSDRGYYTFSRSLTTPLCTENVTWLVLKSPVSVSAAEIEEFSRLDRNDARPTQPLYDRDAPEGQ